MFCQNRKMKPKLGASNAWSTARILAMKGKGEKMDSKWLYRMSKNIYKKIGLEQNSFHLVLFQLSRKF